jgi:hypothetical protein
MGGYLMPTTFQKHNYYTEQMKSRIAYRYNDEAHKRGVWIEVLERSTGNRKYTHEIHAWSENPWIREDSEIRQLICGNDKVSLCIGRDSLIAYLLDHLDELRFNRGETSIGLDISLDKAIKYLVGFSIHNKDCTQDIRTVIDKATKILSDKLSENERLALLKQKYNER